MTMYVLRKDAGGPYYLGEGQGRDRWNWSTSLDDAFKWPTASALLRALHGTPLGVTREEAYGLTIVKVEKSAWTEKGPV